MGLAIKFHPGPLATGLSLIAGNLSAEI